MILVPAILFAGIAWALASLTVPRYAAISAVTLNVSKVHLVDREVVSRLPLESSTLRSEIDIIRSRSLNEEVVVKLGLATDLGVLREVAAWQARWPGIAGTVQDAVEHISRKLDRQDAAGPNNPVPTITTAQMIDWLVGNLSVTNDGRSLTIVISFTSENPERSARIANAVAQTYLDDQVIAKTRGTMMASDWLGRRVEKIREELEKSEAAVDDFRRKSGLLDIKGATIPAQRLTDLNAQLSNAHAERMRAEVKLQTARQSDPETSPDVVASLAIQTPRKELTQLNSEIAAEREYSTFYKLKVLEDRAAVIRKQMTQEMSRIIAGLASEVEIARKKEAQLEQSFQQMEGQVGDAAHSGVRLMQLEREADANRAIYETFLARYKQAMEQESLAVRDARLISNAEPPEIPVYPNMLRFVLLGTFGGLAIGGGLGFLREHFDQRVRQSSEVETVTGIPVYGFLPKVSRWRGLQLQDYPVSDPHSQFGTALLRVHTALRAPKQSDRKHVILVTSVQQGDGKTSFCVGLARLLANRRIRVLVIDADPYRPQLAAAFGTSVSPALPPVTEQPLRLSEIVQTDTKSAADFITAPSREDFQLLVHSDGFAALLEEARQSYDAVIIDTPPVMTSADAALIGRFADTRLLLARWGRTSWDHMTTAIGFLRLCRVAPDGIVMVGTDTGSASYGQLAGYYAAPSQRRGMRASSASSLIEME